MSKKSRLAADGRASVKFSNAIAEGELTSGLVGAIGWPIRLQNTASNKGGVNIPAPGSVPCFLIFSLEGVCAGRQEADLAITGGIRGYNADTPANKTE